MVCAKVGASPRARPYLSTYPLSHGDSVEEINVTLERSEGMENNHREEEIKLIAYRLWEADGCPEGRDVEYYLRAEAAWKEHQAQLAQPAQPATPATPELVSAPPRPAAKKQAARTQRRAPKRPGIAQKRSSED
jgi:hypothetical protein